MDWYNNRSRRSSITTGQPTQSNPVFHGIINSNNSTTASSSLSSSSNSYSSSSMINPNKYPTQQQQQQQHGNIPSPLNLSSQQTMGRNLSPVSQTNSPIVTIPPTPLERNSYYFSEFPLYACDWTCLNNGQMDCIAVGSYKETFANKLEIVHGSNYENEFNMENSLSPGTDNSFNYNNKNNTNAYYEDEEIASRDEGFCFQKVCDVTLDYPITHLQWDPLMLLYGSSGVERLATSSEVLRLYKVANNGNDSYSLQQTHVLANNTASCSSTSSNSNNSSGSSSSARTIEDVNTFPPVTSFDWNKTDPNVLITSSVDTTCTVWDLHRSPGRTAINEEMLDTATVKTQLIAHDSEVFDVKFLHKSTNVFASVGNDGSMRVFDLRSLEHSTIIYEPSPSASSSATASASASTSAANHSLSATFNSKALLTLSTSNVDQHHLAAVGVNSNQIIIIDMRMPGLPVVIIDASLGGMNNSLINLIKWHPTSNYLLSGGDDCQALVWDINNLSNATNGSTNGSNHSGRIIDTPVLAYSEDLEINNVCWRQNQGDWMGVVSGKGFQAVLI